MSKHCNRSFGSPPQLREFLHPKKSVHALSTVETPPSLPTLSIVGRLVAADHEQEWADSGVDPVITRLNVQTLTDAVVDADRHEVSYPIADRLNWRTTRPDPQRARSLRGWWVSGIDPLNDWQPMLWGRFKPDAATPIIDREKGKAAKYLSPSLGKGSSRAVLLDVPFRIWQKVADRQGLSISRQDVRQGFWAWVWKTGVPIVLTEGEKKAGSLLTAGYAAIALPGIFGGCRSGGKQIGEYRSTAHQLIPELAFFVTAGRNFHICFDYETKAAVVQNIFLATCRLGQLLTRAGATVKVISLPGPEKGVDDWIMAAGIATFDRLYDAAPAWSLWQTNQLWALSYPIDFTLNQPYINALPYPETGLAFVKSPKGTGKTTALKSLVTRAIAQDRKVLVITHRIQLGKAICRSLDLDWISDLHKSEGKVFNGFGLCIDSLHPNSQAKFEPTAWDGAIVILDEVEQVIWHALNSSTCYNARVRILETLKELIQHVLETGGLIVGQDADLSDVSINYLQQLACNNIQPWIAVNHWVNPIVVPSYLYDTKTPAAVLSKLPALLEQGAVFIGVDSQKVQGRWSSKNLETYLNNQFPDRRILRIDSETVTNSDHPAFNIAHHINDIIANYDIVIATPTIGTGVSIDIKGHFTAVLGIFQGVVPDSETRQAIARVRENVPRYIWAAKYGPGRIGNGSCFYRDIANSTTKSVKYNITLLREVDFDLDQQTDPIALRTWSQMAARVNLSLWQFRESLRHGLVSDGHPLTIITDDPIKLLLAEAQPGEELLTKHHDLTTIEQIYQAVTAVRVVNQAAAVEAIMAAENHDEPAIVTNTATKTSLEKLAQYEQQNSRRRKQELQHRYPVTITPELTVKDDKGWYQQLCLHYYVTHDPLFVQLRDKSAWQNHLDRGQGKVALQDVQLLTAQVEMLKAMGILGLLDTDRKIRVSDADIQRIAQLAWEYRRDVKLLFNMRVTEKTPPMTFIQGLLAKMDVKLTAMTRDRMEDGRRGGQRVYRYYAPTDDRVAIFMQWEARDRACVTKSRFDDIKCRESPV
jgi:hypothetical protein